MGIVSWGHPRWWLGIGSGWWKLRIGSEITLLTVVDTAGLVCKMGEQDNY